MSRLSSCLFSLLCLLAILTGQISGFIWRTPPPPLTYPADPADSFYQAFQTVPPLSVTADKFMSSFLGIGRHIKRSYWDEDVVLVIDGSGSIGSCEFDKGKKALVNLVGKMKKPGYDTRYAAVTYSSSSKVNFKFTPRLTAASKIMSIRYPGGGTNTQAGLAEAKKLLFDDPSSGRRRGSEKIVILVTDGMSNSKHLTIRKAQELKGKGVKILVVAVGSSIYGIDEMVKVASSPTRDMFRVETVRDFYEVTKLILQKAFSDQWKISPNQDNPPCLYGK